MGTRGPIPNRDGDLARPRERKGSDAQAATRGELLPVTPPDPDLDWHPIARMLWDSLGSSGMRDFYQNTDWATAYLICDEIHTYLTPGIDKAATKAATEAAGGEKVTVRYPERRLSGMTFTALLSAMAALGVTEGDRRRMRIELEAPKEPEQSAQLYAIEGYRDLLEGDDDD